jgi:DNA-binding SARP family transcriptional activator
MPPRPITGMGWTMEGSGQRVGKDLSTPSTVEPCSLCGIELASLVVDAAAVEYRVLGPLEAVLGGRSVSLGGRVQRTVLGALLLQANEAISLDRLVDAVWGAAPPPSAVHAVSEYVSRLRKQLGAEAIGRTPGGYVLRVAPGRLDLERFEELVRRARLELAGDDAARACELLDEGLALWRGRPFADTRLDNFVQAQVARIEELRVAAVSVRAEAKLALGRTDEVIPELEAVTVEHPYDERLTGLLMLALYRAGRQANALACYQATRSRLSEELGLEPSRSLQELERKILGQDASISLEPAESEQVRSVVALPGRLDQLAALSELTAPFGRSRNPHEVILAWIEPPGPAAEVSRALAQASTVLGRLRAQLVEGGARSRVAAFTAADRGEDVLRLARRSDVDLLVLGGDLSELDDGRFGAELNRILAGAPCDVALWFERSDPMPVADDGPILVPFGALEHDWAALELAAWLATTTGRPLVLLGAAAGSNSGRRDASRMLADAGLLIQRASGVAPEPRLVEPGRAGLLEAIGTGCLVVSAVSERWSTEGLGATRLELARSARSPVLFLRRGQRPSGLSPPDRLTLYRWSMTSAGR